MSGKLLKRFTYSYGVILAITGVAKLISAFGGALLLKYPDPIFKFQFRHLLLAAGILEIAIAVICFVASQIRVSNYLVAWFSTSLLSYRLGTWYLGWKRQCPCLGTLTDALHISPQSADTAMKIVLTYLLIVSYASLLWLWWQRRSASSSFSA